MGWGQYILNNKNEPVPVDDAVEWGQWYEHSWPQRCISQSHITPKVRVSTIFLGLDYNFFDGPPILYETMVFGGTLDQEQDRYYSRAEAIAGHARTVSRVRKALWQRLRKKKKQQARLRLLDITDGGQLQ